MRGGSDAGFCEVAPFPVGWKYLASSIGSVLCDMPVKGRLSGVTPPVESTPDGTLGVDWPTGRGNIP